MFNNNGNIAVSASELFLSVSKAGGERWKGS